MFVPRLKTRAKVCRVLTSVWLAPELPQQKRQRCRVQAVANWVQVVSVQGDKVLLSLGLLGDQEMKLSDVREV